MKKAVLFLSGVILLQACSSEQSDERAIFANDIEKAITKGLLNKWYPAAMDKEMGGFLSTFTFDFKPTGEQDKMIVSQARHVWTTARAAMAYPNIDYYLKASTHGVNFLMNFMWDENYGGFHTLVDRAGNVISNPKEEKTAYGNAFAIYGLAAYVMASKDTSALSLAKK